MMACSPMPSAACLDQQGWNNNKKTILSIIRHDADPMIMKPLITTTRRRLLFPPRLSIKATAVLSDPVIVKKQTSNCRPWLMLTPEIRLSSACPHAFFEFYSVAEDKVIAVVRKNLKNHLGLLESAVLTCKGSSHGWLVLFDICSSDLFLYDPLSNRRLKLPSIRNLEGYGQKQGSNCVSKVIISSSDPEGDVDCRALMIHGRNDNLAFCCPSTSDEWIETYGRYQDVVCAGDNLFFGVNDDPLHWPQYPEFEGWDLKDVSRPMLISLEDRLVKDFGKTFPWKGCDPHTVQWLNRDYANFLVAAARRQLFYVCLRRHGDPVFDSSIRHWDDDRKDVDVDFHVHKFDFENGKLVHMDRSLDGLALFVGRNHSFALMSSDDHVKPNSIYFTHPEDSFIPSRDLLLGRQHIKIYNYADGSFSTPLPCTVRRPEKYIIGFSPMWFTPTTDFLY